MLVVIYIRVSTEDQALNGVSLEAQEERLIAYCAAYGHEIHSVQIDDGISGKSIHNRPALQRTLEMLRTGVVGGVVVWKLERLSRDMFDFQCIVKELFHETSPLMLASVTEHVDTKTPVGRMLLNILMSFNQYQRENGAAVTKSCLRHLKDSGQVYCGRLYGFKKVDGEFVEDEHEQGVIRGILSDVQFGYSFSSIARQLNEAGTAPPSGKQWYHTAVKEIYQRSLEKSGKTQDVDLTSAR